MKTLKKLYKKVDFDKRTIEVGNTSIVVHPYYLGEMEILERNLSVWNDVYFRREPLGYDYDSDTKTLFLPATINESTVQKFYHTSNVIYKNSDKSRKVKFKLNYGPRDEKQILAINFLLGRGSYVSNKFYKRLMLSLDTGVGKTYCAIAAVQELGVLSAIILPDSTLMERWITGILEFTDISRDEIYIIKGRESIDNIIKDGYNLTEKIILVSHRTITKYAISNGWANITKLFQRLKIGVKIYDEAHKEVKSIINLDLHTNTDKTIYLTATADRSSFKEKAIYKNIFLKIPVLEFKNTKREDNHINMMILKYNSYPDLKSQFICKGRKGFSMINFMKYNMNKGSLSFLNAINIFLNTVLEKEGRIVIFVGLIDMVFYLEQYIKQTYPKYQDDVGVYCSKISKEQKEDTFNNKRIIISIYKSLGTGADIEGLRFICMAEPYSSAIIAKQCSGRLREKGWYFELIDEGFKDCTRQYEFRKKELIKKANKFKEITIER